MRRFILFVLVVAICVYGLYRWTESQTPRATAEKFTPAERSNLNLDDVHLLAAVDEEYTRLVQAVVPSVVSITATKRVTASAVELFFGRRFLVPGRTEEMHSLGSGVIVSKEGHILTNQHVVADVDEVSIRLANGQTAPARIIGSDPVTDIAVLKVTGLTATPLAFGDSDQVKVGQRVVAVGNPFGFDETVTQGIISAKGRAMEDSANDFVQTDAAINPGNSGGPLVDVHGQIIGINSAVYGGSGSESRQGLGFAIPSNTARRALESIIKTGHVPHGYLGVEVLQPEQAARMGLPKTDGAYVYGVTPGSPAEKAGIRKGDVITSIGRHPVHTLSELRTQIAGVATGSQVAVGLDRANQAVTVTAGIVEQPVNPSANNQPAQPPASATPAPATNPALLAGVHVMEIPPDHQQDLPPNAHGVMVSSVEDGCAAAGTLQSGDVIEEIDRAPIHSVAEYNQAAASATGGRVLLAICRDHHRSFAVVTAR